MPTASRLLSSLLIGTGLGAGPYGAAVVAGGLPTTEEVIEERENNQFGPVCFLDEEMCKIMSDEKSNTSAEKQQGEDSEQKAWENISDEMLKERFDDTCIWGFFDQSLNNLKDCKPEKKPELGGGAQSRRK